ncbi:MAG: DinB family protein [Chloroflexota bacterium]
MSKNLINSLIDYHIWANRQVWECVTALSDEAFTAEVDYSIGSIHNHIFHLMFTDWSSVGMLQGNMPSQDDPNYLKQEDFGERDKIRVAWDAAEAGLRAFVAVVTEEQLANEIQLPGMDGATFTATLAELMISLMNHGTNHRAQLLRAIHQAGKPTVEQGIYFYFMQR